MKLFSRDKNFYRNVMKIFLPVLLQNVITNFVSLLDNVMVGAVGTEPMSGVAIANQLIFVFNLAIFGALSGAGIYTTQFYGKGDNRGICYTVRMKNYLAIGISAIFIVLFIFAGPTFINLFLHEGNEGLDLQATFGYSRDYLNVMLIQIIPFAVGQVYACTLRETSEAKVPMIASIVAVFVNMFGNYILIFGKLGAPKLGVVGAAIATVIARFVETGILVIYAHTHTNRFPFYKDLYKSLKVSPIVVRDVLKKGMVLMLNEFLWSTGQTFLNQCYSLRGLEVVSAINISSTVNNLFLCAVFSSGSTISIVLGQLLGSGELKKAEEAQVYITTLSVLMCFVVGTALVLTAPFIVLIYNTTPGVQLMATQQMYVLAGVMPFHAFTNCCYFTLRSGGKVFITFLFDSISTWCGYVVVAFCLAHFTTMPILPMYICVNCVEVLKSIMGFFMVRSKIWIVNLVSDDKVGKLGELVD